MTFPRAVLFDLDDTLVDRAGAFRLFAGRFIDHFAGETEKGERDEMIETMVSVDNGGYGSKKEVFNRFLERFHGDGMPGYREMEDFWVDTFADGVEPLRGVPEMLGALSGLGLTLGVITNGFSSLLQNRKIDHAGLRAYFSVIVVSKELGIGKPDRRIFDFTLEKLGLRADECLYVGDHLRNDVFGSKNAGLTAVWYNPGRLQNESGFRPDYEINDYGELIGLLLSAEKS